MGCERHQRSVGVPLTCSCAGGALTKTHRKSPKTGVRLEVIVNVVGKLVYFTYLRDANNLLIYRGYIAYTKYHGDPSKKGPFQKESAHFNHDFLGDHVSFR